MLLRSWERTVFYSFVNVFNEDGETLSRLWKGVHSMQGFTWEPRSVSFGTLWGCDELYIEAHLNEPLMLREDAARALIVPFTVTDAEQVLITTWIDGEPIPFEPGNYALMYETGRFQRRKNARVRGYPSLTRMWARFTFVRQEAVETRYLKVDDQITPPDPLYLE